ncbi:MAG TPA: FAD-dependent oxidoreductase [Micromonosporaceae bacterium]|nr:FAD-dependent oxidoreductase [Micromonosporaceae bacterium]
MARPRIVIVGAGFAGYHAARTLSRLSRGRADIALINPTDYFLYLPLLPEVAAGGIDLTRPGELTPMTAQHAQRQGHRAASNIAASYGQGRRRRYKHHDLGFLVDLGGTKAAANPIGVPLAGLPAEAVTRGYHLLALPGNRIRTATDWLLDAALSRQVVQLGLVAPEVVRLECTADR